MLAAILAVWHRHQQWVVEMRGGKVRATLYYEVLISKQSYQANKRHTGHSQLSVCAPTFMWDQAPASVLLPVAVLLTAQLRCPDVSICIFLSVFWSVGHLNILFLWNDCSGLLCLCLLAIYVSSWNILDLRQLLDACFLKYFLCLGRLPPHSPNDIFEASLHVNVF